VIDESLKTGEARAAYERAMAAEPKMLPAYAMLTHLCIKTKDWDCAGKTSDLPAQLWERRQPPLPSGWYLRSQGRYGRSEAA
jgi:hypothetical protein